MKKIPKGSIWKSEKDGKIIFYAEIQFNGKRFKHKGSPNEETVKRWLENKRTQIMDMASLLETRKNEIMGNATAESMTERIISRRKSDFSGTIYKTTYRNGSKSTVERFCAEINCRGYSVRKHSKDEESLRLWMDGVLSKINTITKEYEEIIDENYKNYVEKDAILKANESSEINVYLSSLGLKIKDKTNPIPWFTYVIKDEIKGLFKIGKTKNLKARLSAFCNEHLYYELIVNRDLEKKLHALFYDKRIEGEWFELTAEDLERLQTELGFTPV